MAFRGHLPFSMRVRTRSRVQIDKTAARAGISENQKKIAFINVKFYDNKVVSELHFGVIWHFQCVCP